MYAQQTVTKSVLTRCLTVAVSIAFTIALSVALFPACLWAASATLTWDAPTTNADGTPLTDLAGYRVYHGNATRTYLQPKGQGVDVKNVTSYTVSNLGAGTWFFAVTAYDTSGNESAYSNEVSKVITQGMIDIPSAPNMRGAIIIIP